MRKETVYKCVACGAKFGDKDEFDAHKCSADKAYALAVSYNCNSVLSPKSFAGFFRETRKGVEFRGMSDGRVMFTAEKGIDLCSGTYRYEMYGDDQSLRQFDRFNNPGNASNTNYVVFTRNKDEIPGKIEELVQSTKCVAADKLEKIRQVHANALDSYRETMKSALPKMMDGLAGQLDLLKDMVDSGHEVYARMDYEHDRDNSASWKRRVSKIGGLDGDMLLDDPSEKLDLSRLAAGKPEAVEEEASPSYDDDDIFIMRINVNWADEIDFECSEVVTGKQRRELERRAKECGVCYLSFGSNESDDVNDIMDCVSFQPIAHEEYEVLKRLDMLSVGRIGYSDIYNGLQEDEEDE